MPACYPKRHPATHRLRSLGMPFNKSKALEEAAKLAGQRKLSQAIKQYLAIVEQDPADLSLLNIIGDLCVRDGNIADALRQYYKLGAAYAHEGFSLKAIAIYKKIAKLDAHSVEPLIKLAELYSSQGLSHEAREQYAQALVFCQSHSLPEKAVEILGKLIAHEPENASYRIRLGEFHEAAGRTREASLAYIEAAEIAQRQKNAATATAALGKASHLDSHSARVVLLEARMAVESERFDDAEKFLASAPEFKTNREARLILFDAYLKAQKLDEAVALTVEIYRDDPGNFEAVERFISACLQANNPDAALEPVGAIVDLALERKQAGPLTAVLHRILQAQPRHVSTLELVHAIYERAGGVQLGSELLEELGGVFARAEQWANASNIYRQLLDRAGDNPAWQSLLNEALAHQGRSEEGIEAAEAPIAPEPDVEPIAAESATLPEQGLEQGPEQGFKQPPAALASEPLPLPSVVRTGTIEIDFSSEWKEYAATHSSHAESAISGPAPPLEEEEKTEVQFYLEYGFFAEARASLDNLEAAHPGHPELAELWKKLEDAQGPEAPSSPNAGTSSAPEAWAIAEEQQADPRLAIVQQESPIPSGMDSASLAPAEAGATASSGGTLEDQDQQANLLDELKLDLEKSLAGPSVGQTSPPVPPRV